MFRFSPQVENGNDELTKAAERLPPSVVNSNSAEKEDLVRTAAELLCRHIAPCRFRSQDLMIQLMGYPWLQPFYSTVDGWNAGRLSKEDVRSYEEFINWLRSSQTRIFYTLLLGRLKRGILSNRLVCA